jgi:MFS family permease
VWRPYADILTIPGAAAFSVSALIARLPMSMFGLSVIFAVEAASGSYGDAGVLAGLALLGQGVASPIQARLADRWGQARMLVPVLVAHATGLAAFIVLLEHAGFVVLAVAALVTGVTLPQIGALVRARWARLDVGARGLHTAYAWESVLDEVVFIAGPLVATLLSTTVDPRAGLVLCLTLTTAGGLVYAAQRRTDPGSRRTADAAAPVTTGTSMLAAMVRLVITFAFMGVLFGSIEVVTVAFTAQVGSPGAAGVVLAVFALGSLLAGLVAGSIQSRFGPQRRFVVGQLVLAAAVLPLPFVGSAAVLGAILFVAGFAIAPTLIAGYSLVQAEVPAARLTEGLAWVSTALNAGVAAGAAAAGPIIDRAGASTAFWVPVAGGVLATVSGGLGAALRRRVANT